MGTWNDRILRIDEDNERTYTIVETYYDEGGRPNGWCEATVVSDTREDIADVLVMMAKATRCPVLTMVDGKIAEVEDANAIRIPSFGFARGSVVRRNDGPNMIVVRSLGDRTVVVGCEADKDGTLRLRDYLTAELTQVLASNITEPDAAALASEARGVG